MRNFLPTRFLLLAALTAGSSPVLAQSGTAPSILFGGVQVSLPANVSPTPSTARGRAGDTGLYLVRLAPGTAPASRAGVQFVEAVGADVWMARLTGAVSGQTLASAGAQSTVPVQASWKISKAVPTTGSAKVQCLVQAFAGQEAALKSFLTNTGVIPTQTSLENLGAFQVSLTPAAAKAVAAHPSVRFISPRGEDKALDFDVRGSSGAAQLQEAGAAGVAGLTGAGVVVGIGDDVGGYLHTDLRDRTISFNPNPYGSHGLHVSGTVGGAGIIEPFARGVAPGATMLSHFFSDVWARTSAQRSAYGMNITNNSYASTAGNCEYNGTYDVQSALLDGLGRTEPDVIHVFASGNSGGDSCGPYNRGYGTVIGGYQSAKNVITVGNMGKENATAFYSSSRGPTRDGRLKPEVMSFGEVVLGPRPGDQYGYDWGTSMASPGVAGGLAVLTQRYRQIHGVGTSPPAALLKAVLLAGATDRGLPGPDFTYGFGLINLTRSKAILDSARTASGSVSTGGAQTFSVIVPSGAAQLKVMLVWADPAGNPGAAKALVNDLDLEVMTPGGATHLPLMPSPHPDSVGRPAVERIDRLNNAEMAVINAPVSGTYTITVRGFAVPQGPQEFFLAYESVPAETRFTSPWEGGAMRGAQGQHIYWDSPDTSGTLALAYSSNNGASWIPIVSNLPGARRHYFWSVPYISGGNYRLRLTRSTSSTPAVSGQFGITPPMYLMPGYSQCPSYYQLTWLPVVNAVSYEVLLKRGADLVPVDTTTALEYVFSNLSADSTYFAAIRPFYATGVPGYRSNGTAFQPNTGYCDGPYSDYDLMVESITLPRTGRQGTSTALSAAQPIVINLRNNDDMQSDAYTVSYRVNGGAWQTQSPASPIAPNWTAQVTFPPRNLMAVGTYAFEVVVTHSQPDPNRRNDTLRRVVRQLANSPLNLSTMFVEGFETAPAGVQVLTDSMGVLGDRWDYSRTDALGRLRTTVTAGVPIRGERAASMDATEATTGVTSAQNYLQGTFNLSNYSAANDEVRLDLRYRLHGAPKYPEDNAVWVRRNENSPWVKAFTLRPSSEDPGAEQYSGSYSLSDLVGAAAFTASTAIRIGQHDTAVIAGRDWGCGLTVDEVRLYRVQADVGILSVQIPPTVSCGFASTSSVTVKVFNGMRATASNLQVQYRIDGGAIQSATIPQLPGKDTISFTFPQTMGAVAAGPHKLDVWIKNPGDTYAENDTLRDYLFRVQPMITQFPYLETFDTSNGFFYAEGRRSSWGWGVPTASRVPNAASGDKCWKTNLAGPYNDREESYLYSPCFDLSGMQQPMLSFSAVVDIEDCGPDYVCDAAWVEWSYDAGATWMVLGDSGTGTHWYNNRKAPGWTQQGFWRWHVASTPIPPGATGPVRFRIGIKGDAGVSYDGLAIDDFHVYDRTSLLDTAAAAGEPLAASAPTKGFVPYTRNGAVAVAIEEVPGLDASGTTVEAYTHDQFVDSSTGRYFLPRSFAVKPRPDTLSSTRVRFYVADADMQKMLSSAECDSCNLPKDVYRLGIAKYDDPNQSKENGTLSDNLAGIYNFYPHGTAVKWIPYDAGYYAELNVPGFSEFWFFADGPTTAYPPADAAVMLTAVRVNETDVQVGWTSGIDSIVGSYELERVINSAPSTTIRTAAGAGGGGASVSFVDMPGVQRGDTVSYRLRWRLLDGSRFFSSWRRIVWDGKDGIAAVYPNPADGGRIRIRWSAQPGGELPLHITDMSGRVVWRQTLTAGGYLNDTPVDLPLAPGVYYLQAELGSQKVAQKIVIR